eukprot:TRINITY_DN12347_c1_g5_i3.p1 TRINITY_DN12347_c1_g5~~TRINITY_DN12347_c1_g5_i3.p1  ORF type:complete len:115 (+),score=27.73 TRINITY_DN12347_c1_g5_i3:225-569(+)
MAARVAKAASGVVSKLPQAGQFAQGAVKDLVLVSQPIAKKVAGLAAKELGPPSPAQWPKIQKGLQGLVKDAQAMKFMNVTVAEATAGLLVGVEVACWFYVGEIIGRGSIIGYDV